MLYNGNMQKLRSKSKSYVADDRVSLNTIPSGKNYYPGKKAMYNNNNVNDIHTGLSFDEEASCIN